MVLTSIQFLCVSSLFKPCHLFFSFSLRAQPVATYSQSEWVKKWKSKLYFLLCFLLSPRIISYCCCCCCFSRFFQNIFYCCTIYLYICVCVRRSSLCLFSPQSITQEWHNEVYQPRNEKKKKQHTTNRPTTEKEVEEKYDEREQQNLKNWKKRKIRRKKKIDFLSCIVCNTILSVLSFFSILLSLTFCFVLFISKMFFCFSSRSSSAISIRN